MHVVGRNHVIEDAQSEALARLEQPLQIVTSIPSELEQELTPMTAVSDVPDKTG